MRGGRHDPALQGTHALPKTRLRVRQLVAAAQAAQLKQAQSEFIVRYQILHGPKSSGRQLSGGVGWPQATWLLALFNGDGWCGRLSLSQACP